MRIKGMKISLYSVSDNLIYLSTIFFFFLTQTISFALGEGNNYGKYILLLVMIAILVFLFVRENKYLKIHFTLSHYYLLSFCVLCLISSLWAVDTDVAFSRSIDLFEIFIMYSLFYLCYRREKYVDRILRIIMFTYYMVVIYSISYYGLSDYIYMMSLGVRVSNDALNANTLGMDAAYAVLINIYYIINKKLEWYTIFMVPALFSIAVSASKKAIILLIIGIILLQILKVKDRKNIMSRICIQLFKIVIVLVVIYAILQLPMFNLILERINEMVNVFLLNANGDSSSEARLLLLKIGYNLFLTSPFLGIGIDNAQIFTYRYFFIDGYYLHNNFIELLADLGVIGFLLYYSIYLYIFIKLIKRKIVDSELNMVLTLLMLNLIMDFGMVSYESKIQYLFLILYVIKFKSNKSKEV